MMKKITYLFGILIFSLFVITGCNQDKSNNSNDDNNANNENSNDVSADNSVGDNSNNNTSKAYLLDLDAFSIEFAQEPKKSTQPIQTAVGNVDMITFMYEESMDVAYMLAYIDYPEDAVKGSDPYTMLDGAKTGYTGNLGLTVSKEEKNEIKGNEGVYFEASNDELHSTVQDFLVKNRLYQIAILRADRAPTSSEVESFIKTFKLK